ncbi:flagellar motor switch protein FliM [uncultured Sphingomonas sp.]|uniref:flagellar motor switch protein FliM n=1 Tax=uncultured Sphingomonas sp. TaxID=158754 RepID=UPI0035CA3111
MVNAATTKDTPERRERTRGRAAHDGVLGAVKLNPFGDLHTLQHLSARLARSMRGVFEPVVRREVRCWAEPLSVERFADYRQERSDLLTAWLPLAMTPTAGFGPTGQAFCMFDGRFILGLLDLFFGGTGAVAPTLPTEFSPAAEALIARLGASIAVPLAASWEPLARINFTPGRVEANAAILADIDGDDPVIVTRFGLAIGDAKPVFVDLVYPVAALKPHGASLTAKVLGKTSAPDPQWRSGLTRAAMTVRFPIRSVLAEPVVSLSMLMALKAGDVIPIDIANEVPVMVGKDRLGCGTVGTSNGRAAIQLTSLSRIDEGMHS